MTAVSNKASKDFKLDAGKIVKQLLPKFGGRGGGKVSFAQGTVANDTEPQTLFDEALGLVDQALG